MIVRFLLFYPEANILVCESEKRQNRYFFAQQKLMY